jgi:hypothetical protein
LTGFAEQPPATGYTCTTTGHRLHLHNHPPSQRPQPQPDSQSQRPPSQRPQQSNGQPARIFKTYIPLPKAAIAICGKVRAMFLRETHPFLMVIFVNRLIITLLRKNRLQKSIKTTTFLTKTLKKKPQKLSLGANKLMFFPMF